MSVIDRFQELRAAAGGPRSIARKTRELARSVGTMLDRTERDRRIARLQALGLMGERPTDWQMLVAAHHMMFGFILPSNLEFYAAYGRNHTWAQVLRFLDEPSAMVDPIGLGISKQMLISHLIQVVHTSAGYDVALIALFDDGLADLRAELEQLVAGTHPRQAALEAILERPDFPRALLDALDRFEADPTGQWRVLTYDAPEGCGDRFDWGIEHYGSPGRLFAYARTLPESPLQTVGAWLKGELRMPRVQEA